MTLLRDPKAANLIAALGLGRPDLVDDLNEICERESKCMAVGMHTGDAKYSNPEWRGQVATSIRHASRATFPAAGQRVALMASALARTGT